MSTSEVSIINEALVRIGAAPIGSLEESNAQALSASGTLETVFKASIASHPWSFALRSQRLSQLQLEEHERRWHEGGKVYQLPSDCLRVLGLDSTARYEIAGDQLYTDDNAPILIYLKGAAISAWPAYFRLYIVNQLAATFAVAVTDSNNRATRWEREAALQLRTAMSLDSQQVPAKVFDLMRIYTRIRMNPLAGG